jgi:L-malate glycosyltransferase
MATGNGAFVVHKVLEKELTRYRVFPYNPYCTLFPFILSLIGRLPKAVLVHTSPDYAIFHKRRDIPLVITFHNYVLDPFMSDYSTVLQNIHYRSDLKLFTKLAVKNSQMITAVSHYTANLVKQHLNLMNEVRVIQNGIDHDFFMPVPKGQNKVIQVLFCGNLTMRKGAQWLIPIAELLNPGIEIIYTTGLRAAGSLTKHSRLRCIGAIPHQQMPQVFQQADILLFPTVREGLSLAAIEAMSCGLPIVASNCSSLPELIEDKKGGFLCQVGDVLGFAEKINLLADDAKQRKEMGTYNRVKVEEQFTLKKMVNSYKELFEETLDKRK